MASPAVSWELISFSYVLYDVAERCLQYLYLMV